MGPTCPSCSADNVQRQRLAYEAGTASINATTMGLGRGLLVAGTSGRQQSDLAARLAPPSRAPTWFAVAFGCFGLALAGTGQLLFGGILAAIFALVTAEFVRQNKVLYPQRLAAYERKWICLACGNEWLNA
jgi:hypothetical protein